MLRENLQSKFLHLLNKNLNKFTFYNVKGFSKFNRFFFWTSIHLRKYDLESYWRNYTSKY